MRVDPLAAAFAATLLACASTAIALLVVHARRLAARARVAEQRFDLLRQIAPALTSAAVDSTAATCARILARLEPLVPSRTSLCFFERDGRLVLGAKAGGGYTSFLVAGAEYAGASIIEWAWLRATPAIVGPAPANVPRDVALVDLSRDREGAGIGPAAGSRDRVWAVAAPLSRDRGAQRSPEVLGVLYLERPRDRPFSTDELRTIVTVAGLAADALTRAMFADAVRRDAEVDGLTSLLTPTAFRKRLRDEIAARRDVALLFIDTDRFKRFNDTYGHASGDQLLRRLAALFASTASRGAGFAGRNGGDEFCIAMLDRTKDSGVEVAERLRAAIDRVDFAAELGLHAGADVKITASIGIAHFPFDVVDERNAADRLLEIADAQMYEAKRAGRNRIEFLRMRAARGGGYPGEGPIPRR